MPHSEEDSPTNQKAGEGETQKRNALRYLVRGIMGLIVAVTLVRQLFYLKLSNFWIYLGVYFIANGLLSFKEIRSTHTKRIGSILGPVISIIGGSIMVVAYPFSAYAATLVPTDAGKFTFGAIVSVIGLLEVLGKVRIAAREVVKNIHLIFGGLEILLGVILIAFPLSWETRLFELAWITIALLWIIPVAIYMFLVAYQIHNA